MSFSNMKKSWGTVVETSLAVLAFVYGFTVYVRIVLVQIEYFFKIFIAWIARKCLLPFSWSALTTFHVLFQSHEELTTLWTLLLLLIAWRNVSFYFIFRRNRAVHTLHLYYFPCIFVWSFKAFLVLHCLPQASHIIWFPMPSSTCE